LLSQPVNPNGTHALVFDFGGVIFDWDPFYLYRHFFGNDREKVNLFLEEIKLREWNFQLDLGAPFKETVAAVAGRYPQHSDKILAFDERWLETMGGTFNSTVSLLEELHSRSIPLYALSNWSREKFNLVEPDYPFLQWFTKIVISGDEGVAKPDERLFQRFLEHSGLDAESCLFIDDSPANVSAASALGFDAILSPRQIRSGRKFASVVCWLANLGLKSGRIYPFCI